MNEIFKKIEFKHVLSLFILVFAFTLFVLIMFINIKATAQQYASQIITALIAFLSAIVGYFIGSSNGSQKKDAVISSMTQTTPPAQQVIITPTPSSTNDQMPNNEQAK